MSGVGVPTDESQKTLIDKVAQYVAKNGDEFANMMKKKQSGNPEYDFLRQGKFSCDRIGFDQRVPAFD